MAKYVFEVPDMSCGHCRMRISRALEVAGIKEFQVSLEDRTVSAETQDPDGVKAAIEDAGYDAFLRRP